MDRRLAGLLDAVGPDRVVTDPDVRAGYEVDWTGRWRGHADAVVRPRDAAQVAQVVRVCREAGVPLVPQGGNTGLVGGGVPVAGGVVVSLRDLDHLGPVDTGAGEVLVGAGATLAAVQTHVAGTGWDVGVDLAARGSATIGGMVATNAGGIRVFQAGWTGEHVRGLEVVLPSGRIARPGMPEATAVGPAPPPTADRGSVPGWSGLHGDALRDAMVGSEGTLGLVTAVRLGLVQARRPAATLLLGVAAAPDLGPRVETLQQVAAEHDVTLLAIELLTEDGLHVVGTELGEPVPVTQAFALLVEVAAPADDVVLAAIASLGDDEVVVAPAGPRRDALWRLRERHSEVAARLGPPIKLDVWVPPRSLGFVVAALPGSVHAAVPGAWVLLWGHAAVGGLHVNVLGAGGHDAGITQVVERLVVEHGGRVAGEHGVGRAKRSRLHLARDEAAIHALRRAKATLDPAGLCNPGVLLPHDG